jgi:hypothetical protein
MTQKSVNFNFLKFFNALPAALLFKMTQMAFSQLLKSMKALKHCSSKTITKISIALLKFKQKKSVIRIILELKNDKYFFKLFRLFSML